jgi:tetratricopeptide (TPR) repeat protein
VGAAGGAGGGAELGSAVVSPEFTQAVAEIKAEHWPQAIGLLEHYLNRARNDADGHNWLAYAYRKSGQLEPAFAHYKRALAINPTHLGAHEYMGEAYLMAGKPDLAEYHLRELARICAASCEEYTDLKLAIAQYRGKPAGTASAR